MLVNSLLLVESIISSVAFSTDRLLPLVDTHHSCLRCIRVYPVIDIVAFAAQSVHVSQIQ